LILSKLMPIKYCLILILVIIMSGSISCLTISSLSLQGNLLISAEKIETVIFSAPGLELDLKTLTADVKRISKLYEQNGYPDVIINYPEIKTSVSTEVDIIISINENQRMSIDEIQLSGNSYLSSTSILETIETQGLSISKLSGLPAQIADHYGEQGFLFAEVKIDSIRQTDENEHIAYLNIIEHKPADFSEFVFRGNRVTRENTLLKLAYLDRAYDVTPKALKEAEENISKRPYIKSCRIIPLDHRKLLIEIEEDRMTILSGLLGINNAADKNDRITGFANVEFLNLFGSDRSLEVFWEKLPAQRELIDLNYHESGIARIPVQGDFSLSREEVDSTYVRTNFKTMLYYYNQKNNYGIYLSLDQFFPGTRRPKVVEKTGFTKLGVFWDFDSRDNIFNPTRGITSHLLLYNVLTETDGENLSKNAAEIDLQFLHKLSSRFIGEISSSMRIIENKDLTIFEYFYLGGSDNLRGFLENQFTGFRVGWLNLELRYLLSRYSRVFVFGDYGYVKNPEYTMGKLFSLGLGLRIRTKLGLLGIDYGLGYENGNFNDLQDGLIHFGIETKL